MDTLEGMRTFVRAVQLGSLSAAGREVGLSPGSVSRKISQLEHAFRARLLNRTSRKLALTTAGRLYFDQACKILNQIDALSQSMAEQQSAPRGLLTVHTRASIAEKFLSNALPNFLLAYPDITLRLTLSEDDLDLFANKIDLSIRVGTPEDQNLTMRRLSQGLERILYASPLYLASHPEIRAPEDLLQHNCLSFPQPGLGEKGEAVWHCRSPAGAKEVRVSGNLQVNDAAILHNAVVMGVGIGLLPAWLVADDLSFGRVKRVLPHYEFAPNLLDHGLYAVFPTTELMLPKVRVFLDFLIATFRTFEPEIGRMAVDAKRHSADSGRHPPDALRWVRPSIENRRISQRSG
ncbi:MAG: LysR family transcriptional regulator [Rhizorhabdus sp.]|uniref:LysR family transcriptional regulator n=1 Tax=Rhizorhabdus sp. TaxID=1968843 RepID=UPI001B445B20|nr:LysR family transcriptional regulator [Rhizorhabdus sp.]MBP8232561.1 LysR family transcriptional regulator [Rhizorhabdus sp.]